MSKVYKVWSADRKLKKLIKAGSLKEFIKQGSEKLGYGEDRVSVVADLDGTSVEDEDYFDTLPNLSRLMLIRDGETWLFDPGEGSYDQPDAVTQEFHVSEDMQQTLSMLRLDITKIVTLSKEELQNMVDMGQVEFGHFLNVPSHEVVRIQDQCQRYLDELTDSQEALDLLRIIQNTKQQSQSQSPSFSDDSPGSTTDDQPTEKRAKKS